jgi:membrane-associated phospholipid phosphatase
VLRAYVGVSGWLSFFGQVALVALVSIGDDIVRGNIFPADARDALQHAHAVITFESTHGILIEPALQSILLRNNHVLGFGLSESVTVSALNAVYAFCHLFVTLLVAGWVFAMHRDRFGRLRNVMLVATALALVVYELYPLAPPRLSSGLTVHQRVILFHDTVRHFLGVGRLSFASIGYNPYAAMPSVHVAWAAISGVTLSLLARRYWVRALGLVYPVFMAVDVIATGNHYFLDVLGALVLAATATLLVLAAEYARAYYGRAPGRRTRLARLIDTAAVPVGGEIQGQAMETGLATPVCLATGPGPFERHGTGRPRTGRKL